MKNLPEYSNKEIINNMKAFEEDEYEKITIPIAVLKRFNPKLFVKLNRKSQNRAYQKTEKHKAHMRLYQKEYYQKVKKKKIKNKMI